MRRHDGTRAMVRIDRREKKVTSRSRQRAGAVATTTSQCAAAALIALTAVAVLTSCALSIYHVSSLEGNTRLGQTSSGGDGHGHAPAASNAKEDDDDSCEADYRRANRNRTPGLTAESVLRSRAWIGNRQRLDNVARNLTSPSGEGEGGIHIVTFGGSITLGHGVATNTTPGHESGPYGDLLELRLNDAYGGYGGPGRVHRHRVFNMAAHGADMCALEKRINGMLLDLTLKKNAHPDLFLLEFAVNDYQGQDNYRRAVHVSRTDVFFDGFRDLALCAEVVVSKLLRSYPRAAVMFLEFRTGILDRRTAQFLHLGVAQHYEVPVVSYAEAVMPEYFRLVSMLNSTERYTVPHGETVLPFPYGCHPCRSRGIQTQFNHFNPPGKRCRTVCDLMDYGGVPCDQFKVPPEGRDYCHPAIFAVDAVHPSLLGHEIARDLIFDVISSAVRDRCKDEPFVPHVLPARGWLGSPASLVARGNFALVNDTDCALKFCRRLEPTRRTPGFTIYSDSPSKEFLKNGWIATNPQGNETIEFDLDLPPKPCYAVFVAVMRSYRGMGKFEVVVRDVRTGRVTRVDLDGLWGARISVWSDNQITKDDDPGACTGRCKVRINTKPQIPERDGNKVKVLTLSARECSVEN